MGILGGGGGSIAGQDHGLLSGLLDDDHTIYLLLAGRVGGQVIGALTPTGGAATDLTLAGRLLLGDNLSGVNYTAGRGLDYRQLARNSATQINIQYAASGFTGTASGTWRGLQVVLSGTAGWTAGTINIGQGFFFTNTVVIPSGVGANNLIGGVFQSSPNETGSAVVTGINNVYGLQSIALGTNLPNTLHVGTKLVGLYGEISVRSKPFDTVFGCEIFPNSSFGGTVDELILFGTQATWTATAAINYTYGLKLDMLASAITNFTNRYGLWVDDWFAKNVLNQPTTISGGTDPIHGTDNQSNFGWKTTANKVAAYNAAGETVIPGDATAGAFAVNLPTAVGILGRVYIVKKVDASANAVTVTPNGAETIDGAATAVLAAQWDIVRLVSDNANWLKI